MIVNYLGTACKCHTVAIHEDKILELKPKAERLQEACRDGKMQEVQRFLVDEAATGALKHLLAGLKTSIHGELLTNQERNGIVWNHTESPVWVALYNKHTDIAVHLLAQPELRGAKYPLNGIVHPLTNYSDVEKKALPDFLKKYFQIS